MEVKEPIYITEQVICDDSERVMKQSKDTNQTF